MTGAATAVCMEGVLIAFWRMNHESVKFRFGDVCVVGRRGKGAARNTLSHHIISAGASWEFQKAEAVGATPCGQHYFRCYKSQRSLGNGKSPVETSQKPEPRPVTREP